MRLLLVLKGGGEILVECEGYTFNKREDGCFDIHLKSPQYVDGYRPTIHFDKTLIGPVAAIMEAE